jgi:NADPH-dependent glutamate synthase beta subunit-like oxidoreductase
VRTFWCRRAEKIREGNLSLATHFSVVVDQPMRPRVRVPLAAWPPIRCFSSSAAVSAKQSGQSLGGRPFRVAVIGGGPAGFYAASRLLSLPESEKLRVDLFELLPVPFGLARFGVAPDHPEVKVWLLQRETPRGHDRLAC